MNVLTKIPNPGLYDPNAWASYHTLGTILLVTAALCFGIIVFSFGRPIEKPVFITVVILALVTFIVGIGVMDAGDKTRDQTYSDKVSAWINSNYEIDADVTVVKKLLNGETVDIKVDGEKSKVNLDSDSSGNLILIKTIRETIPQR